MSNPEVPDSTLYEPTQEELKDLYDGLYTAAKSPNPRHTVTTKPNAAGSAILHDVVLSELDAFAITQNESAKYISIRAKEIIHTYGSGETSMLIDIGLGERGNSVQISQIYYFTKQPAFGFDRNDEYSLSKTIPDIEDTSQPIIVEYASEQGTTAPLNEESPRDESLDAMHDDMRRITQEDLTMLGRLSSELGL
ncbi:MAG TPA: hypothetical protein VGF75_03720 [Candidatus Saccharimonadales bacterium]|jgi:hypothetical protein